MNSLIISALAVFPVRLEEKIKRAASFSPDIYEIHLIGEKAVYFYTSSGIRFVTDNGMTSIGICGNLLVPSRDELDEITDRAASFSGFCYEKELKEGFITYNGGFRIGICTSGSENNFSRGRINSLCIRIPDNGNAVFDGSIIHALRKTENGLLISGPPCSGKTSLLKYTAQLLSDGKMGHSKVAVIDERGELSAGNKIGFCTDIIGGKEKSAGILHALRLTSPQYILCDEIGTSEEADAVVKCLNSGVKFICTMHAGDIRSLIKRRQFRLLFREDIFDNIIFLSGEKPGTVSAVYSKEEVWDEINGHCSALHGFDSDRFISYAP